MNDEILFSLAKSHLLNDVTFPFWIYNIENLVVKNKRYLKVFLFNRYLSEEELNQIEISHQGSTYTIGDFSIVSEYNSKNVIGFLCEIDIEDGNKDIKILKEIVNGTVYNCSDNLTEYCHSNQNEEKIVYAKKAFHSDFYPELSDSYWKCSCGRINNIDKPCRCGLNITDVKKFFDFDPDQYRADLFTKNIPFGPKYGDTFSKALESYKNEYAKKESTADAGKLVNIIDSETTRKKLYDQAVSLLGEEDSSRIAEAKRLFAFLEDYSDSPDRVEESQKRFDEAKAKEEAKAVETKKKKTTKLAIAGIAAVAIILLTIFVFVPLSKYNNAKGLMNQGDYDEAIEVFKELGDYKDCDVQINECNYLKAESYLNEGLYKEARDLFASLMDYRDSRDRADECRYYLAVQNYNEGKYEEAFKVFKKLGKYQDSEHMMELCNQGYVYSLKHDVEVNYWDALDSADTGTSAAKNYITINSIRYTVSDDNNVTFNFDVRSSRKMNMSFFSPPSGDAFMLYNTLSSGSNKYSVTVPLSSVAKSTDYYITCKFYNDNFTITGYISTDDMARVFKANDLYGNKIIELN